MDNEKIVHEVKGKLSPFMALAQLVERDAPDHLVKMSAERCVKLMPEIVKLLDEIE